METPIYLLVAGVIIGVGIVATAIWFIFKVTENKSRIDKMLMVFIYGFVAAVSVFVVDKIVGVRTDLLTEKESEAIFALISGVMSFVLGYVAKSLSND